MKRIASLIFVGLMIGLPLALGQDAAFDEMAAMEMEMGSAEMGGLVALMAGMGLVMLLISLIPVILFIVCMWKLFAKAAKPGWASLVPIYNTIVMIEIAGKPLWWFVLLLIPFVNVVFGIILMVALARNFGKGGGYAAGLILLPIVFFPMLAFGKAAYLGADGSGAPAAVDNDGFELDEVPQTEASAVASRRLAATDVSRSARAGAGAFSGVTGFTIVAMLGLFIFIAVITLQCLEIFHLDGTMDDGNSIWPPKP